GAGAEVDDTLAGLRQGEACRELRALVLDLELAIQKARLALQRGAAAVLAHRKAQAVGGMGRGQRTEVLELAGEGFSRRLERVDADVERRTRHHGLHLVDGGLAEGCGEGGREPFREVARDMRRCIGERWRGCKARRLL